MTELNEKLTKHLSNIKEANERKVIIDAINSAACKEEKELYKVCLECCKTGKFIPSNKLINTLVELIIVYSEGGSDDDIETAEEFEEFLKDEIENYCLSDEWREGIIGDTLQAVLSKLDEDSPIYNPWLEATKWAMKQDHKVYNLCLSRIKKEVQLFKKNVLGN